MTFQINIILNVLIVSMIGFYSCATQIEIEHPVANNAIVINSFLSNVCDSGNYSSLIRFEITNLNSINEMQNKDSIKDAIVEVKSENGYHETLRYDPDNFYSSERTLKANDLYSLEVEVSGGTKYEAKDFLPDFVFPNSVLLDPYIAKDEDGKPIGQAKIYIDDPKEVDNYYEVEIALFNEAINISSTDPIITNEYYYPFNAELQSYSSKSLLFSDKSFNGKEANVSFNFMSVALSKIEPDRITHIIPSGIFEFHFRSVSKNYYDYKASLLNYKFNLEGDILFGTREPQNIYTNIENGYGIFGAYSESISRIYIDEIKIEE